MATATITPEQEKAMVDQFENGTITIRPASGGTPKRHVFASLHLGTTECGRYDTLTADAVLDSPEYKDCGACGFAVRTRGVPHARR